jgi:hypothetical protein
LWSDHVTETLYAKMPGQSEPLPLPSTAQELLEEDIVLFDVAIDSNDNIVIAGTVADEETGFAKAFIKKYNPNGGDVWTKLYNPYLITLASGIDIDSNNNIYVVGWGGTVVPPAVEGWIMKLKGSTGQKMWQKSRSIIGKFSVYNSVVVDSSNNAIAAGSIIEPDDGELDVLVTKFWGALGWRLKEKTTTTNAMPNSITIDDQENFVIVGVEEGVSIQTHYLLKLTSNFGVAWEVWGIIDGFLMDVAVMDTGDYVVTGVNNQDTPGKYYASIYSKNTGNLLLNMDLGDNIAGGWDALNDYMKGVAIDSYGDLYVTGAATVAKTIKVEITGGPPSLLI